MLPLMNEKGETLYCACLEFWASFQGKWVAETKYLHAKDTGEARAKITIAYPRRDLVRIVGVAPAIGFHVEDDHGERLRA